MNLLNQITGKSALIARNQLLEKNFQLFKGAFENLKCESQALRDTNKALIQSSDQLDKSNKDLIRTHQELIEVSDKLREEVKTLLHEIEVMKDEQKESHKEVMDGIHDLKDKEKPIEMIDCRGLSLLRRPEMPTLMAGVTDVIITEKDLIHAKKLFEDTLRPISKPEILCIDEAKIIDAEKEILSEFEQNETKTLPKYIEELALKENITIHDQDNTNVKPKETQTQNQESPEQEYEEGFRGKVFDGANYVFLSESTEKDKKDSFVSPEIGEIHEVTEKEEIIEKVNHDNELQTTNSPLVIPNIPPNEVKPPIEVKPSDKVNLSPGQKKIVNYISKHPGLTMTKIKEGVEIAATGNYLKILVGKGCIKKNEGDKTYSVVSPF